MKRLALAALLMLAGCEDKAPDPAAANSAAATDAAMRAAVTDTDAALREARAAVPATPPPAPEAGTNP